MQKSMTGGLSDLFMVPLFAELGLEPLTVDSNSDGSSLTSYNTIFSVEFQSEKGKI